MLSSLTQLLATEPLALVGTEVAEPDERELAVAQRRHVPSQRAFKKRKKEHLRPQGLGSSLNSVLEQLRLPLSQAALKCIKRALVELLFEQSSA